MGELEPSTPGPVMIGKRRRKVANVAAYRMTDNSPEVVVKPEPWPVATVGAVTATTSADCTDCPWHRAGQGRDGWLAARAAAMRHVAGEGHAVVVSVQNAYTYAPALTGRVGGHP